MALATAILETGQSEIFALQIAFQEDGAALDLTGAVFTLRAESAGVALEASTANTRFTITDATGATTDGAWSIASCSVPAAAMAALPAGLYPFGIRMTLAGATYEVWDGWIVLTPRAMSTRIVSLTPAPAAPIAAILASEIDAICPGIPDLADARSGDYTVALNATANTSLGLPTSGTLATIAQLGALNSVTPGAGVTTALGNAANTANGVAVLDATRSLVFPSFDAGGTYSWEGHGNFHLGSKDSGAYGTSGTLTGVTATTTAGSTDVTLSADHGLSNGEFITIAGCVGGFKLSSVAATSATLSHTASASVTDAAVAYRYIDDATGVFGYNSNKVLATEPEWVTQFESSYIDEDGDVHCEWYIQYQEPNSAIPKRPFFASVNRDTHKIDYTQINSGYRGLYVFGGVGDITNDHYFIRAKAIGATPRFFLGDAAHFDNANFTAEANLTIYDNYYATIKLATIAKRRLQFGAFDGTTWPYGQISTYDTTLGTGIAMYLNNYGGKVGVGYNITAELSAALDVNGDIRATRVATTVGTVAQLTAAATAGAGARAMVSDSTVEASGNFGAIVAGTGSYSVPVYCDGTNWRIG